MAKRVFIDRTEYPGSHSLQVMIAERVTMNKNLFIELTQSPSLKEWLESDEETNLGLSIPPTTGDAVLPQPAKLIFTNGSDEGNTVSADLRIVIFRRGEQLAEETCDAHMREDIIPIWRTARKLITSPPDITSIMLDATVEHLIYFYDNVDPTLNQPVLKQRLFDFQTRNYAGHICSNCASAGATLRCPCKSGIYYCSKACQTADWPAHKALVAHEKKKKK